MGYFSIEPKKSIENFYNMENEFKDFIHSLNKYKLIVVEGLRRYGKTSLILTGLNYVKARYVFIDCRLLPLTAFSFSDFLSLIEAEISKNKPLKNLIKSVEYLEISGLIRFRIRKPRILINILEDLGDVIIVLDEAQELRKLKFRMDYFIAYALDHLDTRFVVSGSQVGLLYRFMRINDPEAPLYGRPYKSIKLTPLNNKKAADFLRRGFNQEGVEVDDELIERAINTFNGIIGWLTYFGYNYVRGGESLESITFKALKIALSEIHHFLKTRGIGAERYTETLKIVATLGEASWSEIKRALSAKLGHIPDTTLANILKNLTDAGIMIKREGKYRITDPVFKITARELL